MADDQKNNSGKLPNSPPDLQKGGIHRHDSVPGRRVIIESEVTREVRNSAPAPRPPVRNPTQKKTEKD